VKLPPFEIHRPPTLEAASDLLERLGDEAVPYAGGTELLLVMKLGLAEYGHLVDLKGIPELGRLGAENGRLEIGAGVTHRALERSPLVRARWPALAEMERGVANVRVRVAGTLGGNLSFADPHSDPATFLLAVGAEVELAGPAGRRRMPLQDYVLGPYETALGPAELLVAVRVPEPAPGTGVVHRKMAFNERPAVTVTVVARAEGEEVVDAAIAVGSVGLVPTRIPEAEAALVGGVGPSALAASSEAAAAAAEPVEDRNGSPEYKRQLVRVLVGRAAGEAVARARQAAR
jgi:carbon-monoxide dehydrogenase medium subunit